jgi:hypothetical protein
MNNILFLFFLLILGGCVSTESMVKSRKTTSETLFESGKITIGDSMISVKDAYYSLPYEDYGEDPFLCRTCARFYHELGIEILGNYNNTQFLIFESLVFNGRTGIRFGIESIDGILSAVYKTQSEALQFIAAKKQQHELVISANAEREKKQSIEDEKLNVIPNYKYNKNNEFYKARNVLLEYVLLKDDPLTSLSNDNNVYYELLYNQLFEDLSIFSDFNWDTTFIKAYVLIREKHPNWTWADQVEQLSIDKAMWGGHNYIREGDQLIEQWGTGYATFLKSSVHIKPKDFNIIKDKLITRNNECRNHINKFPPSKRPDKLFCRGYSTTGLVLGVELEDVTF